MKRWMLVILLIVVMTPIASTQAQNSCEPNLLDDISKLIEAQAAANEGDTAGAAAIMAEVQANLEAILSACADGNALLTQVVEFPDGLFRIRYPESWSQASPIAGAWVLGNSTEAVNTIVESNLGGEIAPGSQVVVAIYGDPETLFNAEDFEEFRTQLEENGLSSEVGFINREPVIVNDFRGFRYTVDSNNLQGAAYAFDLAASNKIAVFIALTPPGEFPAMEPLFEAVVASMNYGLDVPSTTTTGPVETLPNNGVALSEIIYAQAQDLSDLLDSLDLDEATADFSAVISPDGTRIAWLNMNSENRGLCQVTLSNGAMDCIDFPTPFGAPNHLLWSPDSRYLALTQEWARTLQEPDLWVWDTVEQRITNLTEDFFEKFALFGESDEDNDHALWIESVYSWGPDGNLYFVRHEVPDISNRDIYSLGLYRSAPTGGDAERIRDLSGLFEQFAIYDFSQRDLDGALSISPDASQAAFIVRERDTDSSNNGVWVMSLSGEDAPRQIINMDDFRTGLPQDASERNMLFPMAVGWSGDQQGLFVYAYNPAGRPGGILGILYHYQLAEGVLVPLTDFSSYQEDELNEPDADSGHPPAYFTPRAVVLSPDKSAALALHIEALDNEQAGLWAYTPDAERYQLFEFPFSGFSRMQTATVAADGHILFSGILISPE